MKQQQRGQRQPQQESPGKFSRPRPNFSRFQAVFIHARLSSNEYASRAVEKLDSSVPLARRNILRPQNDLPAFPAFLAKII